MSSVGFAPCPAFEPGPSPGLAVAIVVAYVSAVAVVWAAGAPLAPGALMTVLLAISALRSLRRDAWRRSSDAVVRIARRTDGHWILTLRDGGRWVGRLDDDAHVAAPLVVVAVGDGWRRRFVPVAADALPAAEFRRLRVALRWSPGPLC